MRRDRGGLASPEKIAAGTDAMLATYDEYERTGDASVLIFHQFDIGGLTYGAPEFDEDGLMDQQIFEASSVRLVDFHYPYDAPILVFYLYDFGDSWEHVLELTRHPREAGVKYPRCTAGTRSAPPEDVGGTSGYADFLEAWRDPKHEEHKDMRRWAGRSFNPERFNLDATNKAIARAIRRSRGSYRFRYEE